MTKYKATGCARFLFFLIIFIPVAYFGSQYLMQSGKWDQIRDKIAQVNPQSNEYTESPVSNTSDISPEIKERIERLLAKVNEQADKIDEQEETIHRQNVLIDQLKQRLQEGVNTSTDQSEISSKKEDGKLSLEELLKETDKALKN